MGEPTASNPNQYGDHEPLRLPESGIVVMVSTLYHQTAGPQDHRKWTAPQIPAELSISAALAPGIERGSEDEVARAYKRFRTDEATAWIPTETEVNALGYRLLSERRFDRSIQVFRLNVDSFPDSSNAFDSLGEAYLKAGDHTRAIENYRLSLRKNPDNENARRVLAQLGAESGS